MDARTKQSAPVDGGCVLFVMSHEVLRGLESAQAEALRLKLPLAVVVCAEKAEFLKLAKRLKNTEAKLAAYNIPLIALLGEANKTLAGLVHHTQPAKVYFSENSTKLGAVKEHPYSWPGTVIPISQLVALVETGDQNFC